MNIMIDIETLDSKETACIVSIGAVAFEIANPFKIEQKFYKTLDLKSNSEFHRTFAADTITWWLSQSKEAQAVFSDEKNRVNLVDGLGQLRNFIERYRKPDIWANGISFDLTILRHAFKDVIGKKAPWHYGNEMCMRPLRRIGDRIGYTWSDFIKNSIGVKHNALDDATMQAEYVSKLILKIEDWNKIPF